MGKPRQLKQPNSKSNPSTQKIPKHLEIFLDDKKIFWSFALFDSGLAFPKAEKPNNSFHEIADAIKYCELRTWRDIERNPKRDHPIEIRNLEKFARDRLIELQLDDRDEIWSIRFNGLCRLWAFRDQSLLQVIWLDPQHEICQSHLKHT